MKARDIVIGLLILAAIGAVVYYVTNQEEPQLETSPTPTAEEDLEESFQFEIPEDRERVELEDAQDTGASGIFAIQPDDAGDFTILADVPEPENGGFYQAFLVRDQEGEEDFESLSLGRLTVAKGGYLLNSSFQDNIGDYDRIVVSLQTQTTTQPEDIILESSLEEFTD